MSTMDPGQWQEITPYLDHALSLTEDAREVWLRSLRTEKPELAEVLQKLLEERRALANEHFLERMLIVPNGLFLQGQQVGAYTLLSQIGQGGMGSVWLAERSDGRFKRRVALKFLQLGMNSGMGVERFKREGKILGQLTHPHIAELIDAGLTTSGESYLVLEYVEGQHIDKYCDDNKLDLEARIRLCLDVASAVAYAHTNLIVHRDIKPSNVLVRSDGQAKLLDFGIAKLLAEGANPSATLLTLQGGALTPQFAAPEQITGESITTATDVYALGVLVYLLLTGQHPAGHKANSPADLIKAIVEIEPPLASDTVSAADAKTLAEKRSTTPDNLRQQLRNDLDTVLSKALKKNPVERYASVTAFADDLQRYLRQEPISARPDTFGYRVAKFVQRNRIEVTLATVALVLVIGSLTTGMFFANRERKIAERRFAEVRQLAHQFLALDTAIQNLPGATSARRQIVSTALAYLEALSSEVHSDDDLALEVGTAYLQVARVQGVPTGPNLGDFDKADDTLAKAEKLVDGVMRRQPQNRRCLLTSAEIAHARMILAIGGPREGVLVQAEKADRAVQQLLATGNSTPEEASAATRFYLNASQAYLNLHLYDDAVRYSRGAISMSEPTSSLHTRALVRLTQALRSRGDLEDALSAAKQAQLSFETVSYSSEMERITVEEEVLQQEGVTLGGDNEVSLGQRTAAIQVFQQAVDLIEPLALKDPDDSKVRFTELTVSRDLAALLSKSDAKRAIAIYDHALARVRETKETLNRSTNEAACLADSSLALLQLNRQLEAKERIDAAFGLLRAAKRYPASQIDRTSPVANALRALAGYQERTGQWFGATDTYEELLDKRLASKPDLLSDLPDAYDISGIYIALSEAYRRTGRNQKMVDAERAHQDLWRSWNQRLPNNTFVYRQLHAQAF